MIKCPKLKLFLGDGFMQLPRELKRLIERYKAKYNIEGEDNDILKKVISELEDEDIIKVYDELCEEENYLILTKKGYRPNFEKYREEILGYLDDSVVKAEIIRREQKQSSKETIEQRNYTYISEFTITLEDKADKLKIVKNFYRKVKQLEEERKHLLEEDEKIDNVQLSIHIMQCIKHIVEQMKIDLILYKGPNFKKRYKLKGIYEEKIRKIKRNNESEKYRRIKTLESVLNKVVKEIQKLKAEEKNLKEKQEDLER